MNLLIGKLSSSVGSVIRGKEKAIRYSIVTLLAKGHLLIEDVPGVGKTTLAFSLAKSIDCEFHRIQFTSDLLPSDIIGVNIYNPESREFEFRAGPLFSNIVLADEINRTSPKTQSALLEAMSERRVSVERKTYRLPEPFMVIATGNPVEYHGTFPLPESQLDRFMLHIRMGYPDPVSERQVLLDMREFENLERLDPVIARDSVLKMQEEVARVRMENEIPEYVLEIVNATREDERLRLGASTRGARFLLRASQALAFVRGRDYVLPEDVKELAPLVLGHRVIPGKRMSLVNADELISDIVERISVPV